METIERKQRRIIKGVVVSDKNDKTIVVSVETHKVHSKYEKRIKYRKKYYAHDENNEAKVGDTVTIMATRKLSATKRWRLISIDKIHLMDVKDAEAQLEKEEGIKVISESVEEETKTETEEAK